MALRHALGAPECKDSQPGQARSEGEANPSPANSLITRVLKNCPVVQLFGRANAPVRVLAKLDRGDVQIRGTMSCKDTIHLICWYLERKLSPSVESEIEHHLAECRDCHLVFDAANTTLDRYFGPPRVAESETERTAA